MTNLIFVLGDQLSLTLSSLRDADPADSIVLMAEVADETIYVRHHRRKLAYILSAMRHHADDLRALGWTVDYVALDDPENSGSFTGELARAVERHDPARIVVTEAGEWRVQAMLDGWPDRFACPVEIRPDDRFLCSHAEFEAWANDGRKDLTMEFFYRDMRRRTGLLMEPAPAQAGGGKPAGGRWNFDKDNRKPAKRDLMMPRPLAFAPNAITRAVLALVEARFPDHPGRLADFDFAVTRADALRQRQHFLDHALPLFGDYEDAMLTDAPFLWHSVLSPYINSGLLDPLDLCRAAERRYRAGQAPLNAVEGFIRQIIGWREFMRGIYWHAGPDYVERNFFGNTRPLPSWYWTGDTDLFCLSQAIGQTLDHAYAHHIQRLMITGNFALLIGADPKAVHLWYLEVYADAYEWVELPNTLGMSQFGDGGLVGTKPYAASAAYIYRMSDYCGHCRYDPKQRIGADACPFNALYWDFHARNRGKLGDNPRLNMPYRNWDRLAPADQRAIRAQARAFLDQLDASGPVY